MTLETKKYVLTEKEENTRDAISFLKGCIIGANVSNGKQHKRKVPPYGEHYRKFSEGIEHSLPKLHFGKEIVYEDHVPYYKDKLSVINKNSNWVTICHIIHNRLRHKRPHTGSYDSDQFLLTDFSAERYYNRKPLLEFKKALTEFDVTIPGLEV